jgi:hypothetical protein
VLQNPKLAKDGLLTTSHAKTGDDCAETWVDKNTKNIQNKRKTGTLGTLF